jgi:hypothetical protein
MGVVLKTSGKGQLSNQFEEASSEGAALWYEMFAALLSQIVNVGEIRGSREIEHKIAQFQDKEPFDEAAAQQELSELNEKNEALKAQIDLTARGASISLPPDLGEAWSALAGRLFGPIDPAQVKLKHKEIVLDAKEKREQEFFTLGGRRLASDDNAERGRKDREDRARTLTWLLANDRAYREAHERAMLSFTNAGNAIGRAIEAGEKAFDKARRALDDYLASTARLVDGRYVMVDEDGTYRDQNRKPISAEDAAEVEGQPKRAFKPYDEMRERKDKIDRDLAELRGWDVEVGGMKNEAIDEVTPADRERLGGMKECADDLAARAEEKQREFERSSQLYNTTRNVDLVDHKPATAAMAMPQLP